MLEFSAAGFSKLTTQIYAAALDRRHWVSLFDSLFAASGGAHISVFGFDQRTGVSFNLESPHYAPEYMASYEAHFGALNAWMPGAARFGVGAANYCENALAFEDLRRTEFYNDWVRPQGDLCRGGGVTLAHDRDRVVVVAGNFRRRDADEREARWIDLLGLLVPHFQQALEIGRTLDGKTLEAAARSGGGQSAAILIIDGNGRILHANAVAEALLAEGSVIGLDDRNRLAVSGDGAAPLQNAIAHMRIGFTPAPATLTLACGDGETWRGQFAALDPRALTFSPFGTLCDLGDRCLLLTLAKAPAPDTLVRRMMASMAMSRSEAEIMIALSDGLNPQEIAGRRGTSIHTVRNQIKAAMAKTGVRRQTDLANCVWPMRLGGG